MIKPTIAARFSGAFNIAREAMESSAWQNTAELISSFYPLVATFLTPFKSEPWINDLTRAAR